MDDATTIFTLHHVALERLATRITGDREDARDVVAEAFAALLDGGPADAGHAVAWLYLTVRHRAYNRVRDRARMMRRLPALLSPDGVRPVPEPPLEPDPRIRALLAGAMSQLNGRDQAAVSLRHLQEAAYGEVAAALGTTPAQARVVVHRATARLRRQVVLSLTKHHASEEDRVAVADEVAALSQVPAALPLSPRTGVVHVLRAWWRRAQTATARAVTCLGEVVAPAAALAAVTAGSVLPAAAAAATAAQSRTITVGEAVIAPALDRPTTVDVAPPRALLPATRSLRPTVGSPWQAEDPGTSPGLAHSVDSPHRSLSATLGLTLDVPDPLDAPQGPQVDIQALEIATMADGDGRPAALRWRLGFAAPPPGNVAVWLSWGYDGSPCTSSFSWPGDSSVSTSCPDHGFLDIVYREVGRARATVRIDASTLEATIPFASLDEGSRTFIHPGARLARIVASASCNALDPSGCDNGDRAPDNGGGYDYRIEE